jgi:predicted ArsR family transcriptional regulator
VIHQPTLDEQPPFQAHSATSYEAAQAIRPKRESLQQRVLAYIRAHPGCTDQQISAGLDLDPSTARPRRVELESAGAIRKAGKSKTASGRLAWGWQVTR